MAINLRLRKNKGKNPGYRSACHQIRLLLDALIPKCDSLVAKSLAKLVQQSRALYRTKPQK